MSTPISRSPARRAVRTPFRVLAAFVAIAGAVLAFAGVRMLGIAATTLSVGAPSAALFVWAIPVAACLGALALIFRRSILALAQPLARAPA